MSQTFADPQAIAKAVDSIIAAFECLYEDDEVSVYTVRFAPHELVPPHNHRIHAFLGVYEGTEVNLLYRQVESGQLKLAKTRVLNPGDTMAIGGGGIHAVHTENSMPSLGLHIYLGRLSTVSRELFDTETGQSMPFTDENYQMLVRALV
jgi:predicted metal-dependent enzyme (double-stranded beta helix superfamily)